MLGEGRRRKYEEREEEAGKMRDGGRRQDGGGDEEGGKMRERGRRKTGASITPPDMRG